MPPAAPSYAAKKQPGKNQQSHRLQIAYLGKGENRRHEHIPKQHSSQAEHRTHSKYHKDTSKPKPD
jgi:hypothetical protein